MEDVKVKIVGIAPLLMNKFKMEKPKRQTEMKTCRDKRGKVLDNGCWNKEKIV